MLWALRCRVLGLWDLLRCPLAGSPAVISWVISMLSRSFCKHIIYRAFCKSYISCKYDYDDGSYYWKDEDAVRILSVNVLPDARSSASPPSKTLNPSRSPKPRKPKSQSLQKP